jgi:thioredoxin 1
METMILLYSSAGEIKPYNPAEFAKLAAEGKPILLDVRADWCPTCAAQAPVIRGFDVAKQVQRADDIHH